MGMAASQARLLSITARLHDLEYSAQNVQNAKLQLATQQDEVYDEYLRALDAVTLTFAGRNNTTFTATFNTLFSENAAHTATGNNYILINSRNQVVVSHEVYEGLSEFEGSSYTQSAYNFAMFMIYGEDFEEALHGNDTPLATQFLSDLCDKINSLISGEEPEDGNLKDMFTELFTFIPNTGITDQQLYTLLQQGDNEVAQTILNRFFTGYGNAFFNEINYSDQNVENFSYYMRMFNVVQQHGGFHGCIDIAYYDENNENSNAANNAEWLTAMVQSGQFSIQQVNVDNHGNVSTSGVGVDSDQNMMYSNNTQIDRAALARAEANYEYAMKIIDRKDKKHDMELKKLETERAALTKEYDSVKKVIDDNVEKSFGIFS